MNDHMSICNILNNDISLLNILDELVYITEPKLRFKLPVIGNTESYKAVDAILEVSRCKY